MTNSVRSYAKHLVSVLFLAFAVISIAQDRLTPELLWELGRITLDDVSPDGKTALFGVTFYNIQADKGNRDLYIIPTSGGEAKKITAFDGSENNGQYRPDGKRIGFLRGSEFWEMNPDGSDQRRVSTEVMSGFKYAPDGKHILFIRDVAFTQGPIDDKPEDLPKANGKVITDLMYRHWDSWEEEKYSNVFVVAYEDGKLTSEPFNIMQEPYDSPLKPFGGMEEISWNAQGTAIAYTCKKLSGKSYAMSTDSDIYYYDLQKGQSRNLSQGMNGYDKQPVFSPDGKSVLWHSMERNGYEADRQRIFVYDLTTKESREVSRGYDRDILTAKWSADSKTLYCTTGEKATYQVGSINVATGAFKMITEGVHDYHNFGLASANTIIAERTSMSYPLELYKVDLTTGKQEQLTFINKKVLDPIAMGEVKKRMVKTTDGKDMLVWMIYPPNVDPTKKYPTLLYCQGGPQSAVSQFWSYRWNFQLMAANDYIVVAPNRRGLPSFGQEWNEEISGDWGGQAMKDYLSAIDDAAKEPYIDPDKLGAVGASFGGYSVFWLAGNHNKRFKTFIAHDGVFNLESMYGTTEEMFFVNWDLGGPYWDPALKEEYLQHSPHKYVQNWDTPILVIHGEQDFRVPVGEGMQAFQAAQLRGIPSKFLYFPDENHWVLKPQNGILWHREFFDWLDEWLKPGGRS
ncbi:MAG TPA: S9 family peptidase [Saprospiraceae bacterium]|nr:S9 family peptidase [Saprospiraceae bacterium]